MKAASIVIKLMKQNRQAGCSLSMSHSHRSSIVRSSFALLLTLLATTQLLRAAGEASQTRRVPAFDRIRLSGAFNVDVKVEAQPAQIVVSGDQDLIGRVTTEVHDGTLAVGMKPADYGSMRSPKLVITLPQLLSFDNDGAASVHIAGLNGRDFDLTNSGASAVTVAGRAAHENITLNGTGKINATGVDARDVSVDNNGVGSVFVRASGELTMNVNGVGVIRYSGEPKHVESHINGIGSIGRL